MKTVTQGSGAAAGRHAPRTPEPAPEREPRRTRPRPKRASRSRRGPLASALGALAACYLAVGCGGGNGEPNAHDLSEVYDLSAVTAAQTTSVTDCETELTRCVKSAQGNLGERARCAVDLQSCLGDVVAGRVGQGDLLADCRDTADSCLSAAVSLTDVRVCKGLYAECSQDVLDEARELVNDAQATIQSTFDAALASVAGLSGVTSRSVGALRGCRASANTCLDDALTSATVGSCTDTFDACVSGAIDVIDPILAPLPLPGPRQIFDATAECRAGARECLRGAVDALDIRGCRDLVGACVDDARGLVDVVVDEANGIVDAVLPGAPDVPGPSEVLDCSGQLLSCLGSSTGPVACAANARDCLLQ